MNYHFDFGFELRINIEFENGNVGCDLFAAYICGNLILFSGKLENGIFLKWGKEAVSYKF